MAAHDGILGVDAQFLGGQAHGALEAGTVAHGEEGFRVGRRRPGPPSSLGMRMTWLMPSAGTEEVPARPPVESAVTEYAILLGVSIPPFHH